MPIQSPFPELDIPKCNLLSHIFPSGRKISGKPHWIDAADPRRSLSQAQALVWIKRLALGLDRLGLKRGDVVLLVSPNHIFIPVAYLGIVGGGRCFSGSNPAFKAQEISFQLKLTGASIVLAHPSLLSTVLAAAKIVGVTQDQIYQFSDYPNETRDGIKDWRTIIANEADAESYQWPELAGEESLRTVATINFSSGTTGLPKGVCVSHRNIIANLEQCKYITVEHNHLTKDGKWTGRWVGFLPLYHAYGQQNCVLLSISMDNPVYIMSKFIFEDLLRVIQDYKITTVHLVPPVLKMLVDSPEVSQYDLSSVTDVACGAAPLSKELRKRVTDGLGIVIREGWGMTELTCSGIFTTMNQATSSGCDSVGYLHPNSEAKIVRDDGNEASEGERGDLYVRGPHVFMGYLNNDKATQETMAAGEWLITGDIAVHKNGEFWIVDRKKELIKVRGSQVSPAELEAALFENRQILDAAVVGVQTSYGEAPFAYITLKDEGKGLVSESQIQTWLEGQVSKHKWLTGGVRFVDTIPRLASGKVERKTIREWAKKEGVQEPRSKL